MRLGWALLLTISWAMVAVLQPIVAHASPSEQFFPEGDHLYDDWGVFRTRASGTDGFFGVTTTNFDPIVVYESLGENFGDAWELGQEFGRRYPDEAQRAEEIFHFVRDSVRYTSDSDQFGTGEFAQNADEVMASILDTRTARGDCEDSAILLAVMFKAAGYRTAMVIMPGHVATLVFLPEYRKAPRRLKLAGEDGWIWAEATGTTNPLGWLPESLVSDGMLAREITIDPTRDGGKNVVSVIVEGELPKQSQSAISRTGVVGFLGPLAFLWMMSSGRRGRRRGR